MHFSKMNILSLNLWVSSYFISKDAVFPTWWSISFYLPFQQEPLLHCTLFFLFEIKYFIRATLLQKFSVAVVVIVNAQIIELQYTDPHVPGAEMSLFTVIDRGTHWVWWCKALVNLRFTFLTPADRLWFTQWQWISCLTNTKCDLSVCCHDATRLLIQLSAGFLDFY